MKKFLATAAAATLAATSLLGCGGGSKDIVAESGKKNITVAVGGNFANPDPAIVDDSITANVLNQCYDGLFSLDKDGNVQAELAAEIPTKENGGVSADGLTYTIKLKDGLTWSNGEALTADQFVWSWKRAMTTQGYYTNFMYNYIEGTMGSDGLPFTTMEQLDGMGVKALDDKTIEIKLTKAADYYPSILTNTVFYPVYQPQVTGDISSSVWTKNASAETPLVTSGAFEIVAVDVEASITLDKNEKYREADKVQLETIEFKVMDDADAQTQAFQTGQIDFATSVNVDTILNDENLASYAYIIDPFVCNYYMLMNAGDENDGSNDGLKAMKDVEIRQAISMAINRDAVRTAFGYGDDFSYNLYGLVPTGIPGASDDFRKEGGDLAKDDVAAAKAIMEKKGYSADNMLKLEYKFNNLATHKNAAEAMQAALKEIYIDLSLNGEDKEAFFEERDAGKFECCRHAMTADYLDPDAYLSMYVGKTTSGNTVDDATYEQLVNEGNSLSGEARMQKLHEAEKYLVENAYVVPLFGYTDPNLAVKNLKGITSSPEGHYNLKFAYFE